MKSVAGWLEELDLGKYSDLFAEHEVDFETLPHITELDLKEMGLPIGPRRKVIAHIARLDAASQARSEAPGRGETDNESSPTAFTAERRQVTVLFCDLVGSTELSQELDPEDLRQVLQRYQELVAAEVGEHGGHVAKYLGDGVLAYFGWPQAYEDQAERAIRAGLGIVATVNNAEIAERSLEVRLGIATGDVVVGDGPEEAGAISGETPNLAARLQGLAAPGQVIVGAATRRLVAGRFELNSLGSHALKGFASPVPVWAVLGEAATASRFEASHSGGLSQFVGRETEHATLLDRWQRARAGEGQAVLISGEAGIGKSRLLQELSQSLSADDCSRLRFQCSPHHINSALYPIIQHLKLAAEIQAGEDVDSGLDKLIRVMQVSIGDDVMAVKLMAELLSLPYEARLGVLDMPANERRERSFEVLLRQLLALAENRPVLFLFEDSHWADPTSQDLLQNIVTRIARLPILMLVTHRPEWRAAWSEEAHVSKVTPIRLGRRHMVELVQGLAAGAIDDRLVEQIIARTDGIPLFVEELTKTVLEGDPGAGQQIVPESLQASLLARLDRLGPAKEVAQFASVIGREFGHQMLAQISESGAGELARALDALSAAGLIFTDHRGSETRYIFKHALIQDTAYGSLLREPNAPCTDASPIGWPRRQVKAAMCNRN